MNSKSINLIRNILNVTSSNILVLILGMVITLILPFKLSVESYGYWQLFLLYVSYSGLILFGFTDGIHLRYAGIEYEKLDHKLFRTEFFYLIVYNVIVMCIGLLMVLYFNMEINKQIVLFFCCINMVLFNIHGYFVHISQISFKFKEYSIGISIERVLLVSMILATFVLPIKEFSIYLIMDTFCKTVAIFYFMRKNKEMVFGERLKLKEIYPEIKSNVSSGFFLTATSLVSMMISNYIKFFVEGNYGILEFSQFAFATSMMSLALQAVVSISTVLFPMIKKVKTEQLEKVYIVLKSLYSNISGLLLLTYYIAVVFIKVCIPKYNDVLDYLFILFPILLFDIKKSMLLLIFYKTFRLERETLKNNFIGLFIMVCLTVGANLIIENINVLVLSYLISYFLLTEIAEMRLFQLKKWNFKTNNYSIVYTIVFILINYLFDFKLSMIFYTSIVIILLIKNFKVFKNDFNSLMNFING